MMIYVPIAQIDDNPFQCRHDYGDIEDLAGRIAAARDSFPPHGLMQIPRGRLLRGDRPLTAAELETLGYPPNDKKRSWYGPDVRLQLAFGHRRLRAFAHLCTSNAPGYENGRFPVHVDALSDQQMLDAVWAENQQRKDISAIDEAELLARKLEQVQTSGGSQRDVAEAWGLARPTVSNKLRLLNLSPAVQQANRDGRLSERICGELLRVEEIAQATAHLNWPEIGSQWNRPPAPAEYIDRVLGHDGVVTSNDVRQYVEQALGYAGNSLPRPIAEHAVVAKEARQPTCKGCPARINNTCLDAACLEIKESIFVEDTVRQAATELAIDPSFEEADFIQVKHDSNLRRALQTVWAQRDRYAHVGFVLGWQRDGSGVRPFAEAGYLYSGDRFDNDGRAGIVVGVRGGELPPDVISELAAAAASAADAAAVVEDIASKGQRDAWERDARKIADATERRARELLADALYTDIANSERLAALIIPADADMPDEHEKFVKLLTRFLWDKSTSLRTAYSRLETVETVEALLRRAHISAGALFPDEDDAAYATRRATLLLDYWYSKRMYSSAEQRQRAQAGIDALLAAATSLDAALRDELERALRDIQRAAQK